jgi:hypothetical protein
MGAEFGIQAITLTKASGANVLQATGDYSAPLNTTTRGDEGSAVHDYSRSIVSQLPTQTFSTKALASAFALINQLGSCIGSTYAIRGVTYHLERKGDCQSGFPTSSQHATHSVANGLITPLTLACASRDADAILTCMVDAVTDGTNAPVASSFAASLGGTPDLSQYALGAMRVGNLVFSDCRDFNLDFGIRKSETQIELGGVWAERQGVQKGVPVITLTGSDVREVSNSRFPALGLSATHANTTFYFRKRLNRGVFVADATAEHFAITASGLVLPETLGDSSGATSTTRFRIECLNDGTNFPLIFTPNIAYDPTP